MKQSCGSRIDRREKPAAVDDVWSTAMAAPPCSATLIEGDIRKALLSLGVPMSLGIVFILAMNLIDTYYVGKLGTNELAAMSFTFPVVMVVMSATMGLGVGTTSAIARAIGGGDERLVRRLTTHALILAVADIPAVIAGEDTDPVGTVLASAFGETGSKLVVAVVLLSFISCAMSLQAAASRLAYSYGRDNMIFGSRLLAKFSPSRHVPPYALIVAAAVPAVIIIGSKFSTDALTKIVSFAALGIYIAFQMVVLAALRARSKGWTPSGKYRLGAWAWPVNLVALGYGIIAMINMAWPRTPDVPWYDNYIVALSAVGVYV